MTDPYRYTSEQLYNKSDSKYADIVLEAIKDPDKCVQFETYKKSILEHLSNSESYTFSFASILRYQQEKSNNIEYYIVNSKDKTIFRSRLFPCGIKYELERYFENKKVIKTHRFDCNWEEILFSEIASNGITYSISRNPNYEAERDMYQKLCKEEREDLELIRPKQYKYYYNEQLLYTIRQYIDGKYKTYLNVIKNKYFNDYNSTEKDNIIKWTGTVYEVNGVLYDTLGAIISSFWNVSRFGEKTKLHKDIFDYLNGYNVDSPSIAHFRNYIQNNKQNPYRSAWNIYDQNLHIASQVDFVAQSDKDFIIYGWTDDCDIVVGGITVKTASKSCKAPLNCLPSSKYYAYAILLSLQKMLLEKNYGLNVTEIRLGIFNPNHYSKGYVLRMPFLEKEAEMIISSRSDILY